MNIRQQPWTIAFLATALATIAGAQGAGRREMRPGMDPAGGPAVGDPVPRIELQRLDTSDGAAKPGAREPLADHAKKRPVVLIFSSFT
jgi:hypothetical protein